jgi:TolB-like protein/Flp pilus assembly protein TadD
MTNSARSIFLSYASEDAEAARSICEALRNAGIEVWFDQSELRGGDAWDASIRRQIKECGLFVPIISANTQARAEGYFRLEWKLAVDRSHLMAEGKPFLVPVVIDGTLEAGALVPEKFRDVQWTRLPGGEGSAAFVGRLHRLMTEAAAPMPASPVSAAGAAAATGSAPAAASAAAVARPVAIRGRQFFPLGAGAVLVIATAVLFLQSRSPGPASSTPAAPTAPAATAGFSPPAHSLAVLPFVNMSGDPKQDYFSDGLAEELLNSLVTIRDLQVAARTSSFSFKGEKVDVADIGRKLNVGAVLEGSVRKDGNHVRITAQLINAVTGFHLWSQTYDRDLKNILSLQTDIATAVSRALQATLLADAAAGIEVGGTQVPAAFDAYLKGKNLERSSLSKENFLDCIAAFSEAIRLDPKFAKAYVGAANGQNTFANNFAPETQVRSLIEKARANAETAIALAPELGEAHAAMAGLLERGYVDFPGATAEFTRALELSPNDVDVLQRSGVYFVGQGRTDQGLANLQRAIALDPLNAAAVGRSATAYYLARRYREALAADDRVLHLNPGMVMQIHNRGLDYLMLGELDAARDSCETPKPTWVSHLCLAVLYNKLHRQPEAEAQLAGLKADSGKGAAYQIAVIFAQWGDTAKALDWLETAYTFPDPGIGALKTDELIDPLRKEPRFQEIERKLRFTG